VILGAFPNYAAAQAASAGLSPYIWENNGIYVAQVGAYSTENESQAAVEKLAKRGIVSYVWQERDGFDAIRNRAVSTPPPKQNYHVVMGVFKTQELAKQKASSIASITNYIIWENALGDKTVYRILLGSYTSKADAKTKQQELSTQGIQSFVIFE
jgi:cell division protein FtsN